MKQRVLSTQTIILCALFAALIAIGAFIRIPMLPVPLTLQNLFTSLAGLLLGSNWGAVSVAVYVGAGLLGIPVFTAGGGFSYVINPTFGFLLGFIPGTWLTGMLARRVKKNTVPAFMAACFAGMALAYFIGVIYFYFLMNFYLDKPTGIWAAISSCVLLFIPGDILKCVLSAFLAKRLRPVVKIKGVSFIK